MKKPHAIRYLPVALRDLGDIFDYIRRDNPGAAGNLLEAFDAAIGGLGPHPLSGIVPRDARLKALGYRMVIVERYLVFYLIKGKTVQIRRIIHGARRYAFLLGKSDE